MSGLPTVMRRKRTINEFFEFIKAKSKDGMKLNQILSLFCLKTGLRKKTVDSYLHVLVDSGVLKVDVDGNIKTLV